jgi:flagellar biosynthesis protein FlhB
MAGGGSENKSEKPTRRKLQKAREKGQVPRSKEVSSAAVLLGGLMILLFSGQAILRALQMEMYNSFNFRLPSELSITYISSTMNGIAYRIAIILLPILLTALIASVAANVFQGGWVFASEALGLHFDKLNPSNGMKRIFSINGLMEFGKNVIILLVVSYLTYQVISKYLPLYPRLVLMDVRQLLHWITQICFEVFIRVSVLLIVIAVADYYFQKYRFTESMKMTKQEVKDEYKEMEGDPTTKSRIRRVQREMSRKRMMANVPKADVVITNPTHYAVALSYKMDAMDAPVVVAKGVGFLALKIRELAQQHSIPIVENRPLAQALYKTVDVDQSIPASLYKAVAEILAYVYRAKNALIH